MEAVHYSILLVEDNPDDATLMAIALEAGREGPRFSVATATTVDAALAIIWSTRIDAVLLDLALPDSFGLGTLELILGAAAELPVVVLTGLADDEAAVEAVALGAQEYVVKGAPGTSVATTLHRAIVRHRHATRDPGGDERLAVRHTHDVLTGLPNRFLFAGRLRQGVARATRYDEPLGLLTLGLRSVPWANSETVGAGRDAVLIETARRLQEKTRLSDTVARIDDEMFGVIMERAGSREAVSKHLDAVVHALEVPVPWKGTRISVRIRPGLAFCPEDGGSEASLLEASVADGLVARG